MNARLSDERNRVRLVDPGTGAPGHFHVSEFANAAGLAMVQPATVWALERIRAECVTMFAPARVALVVTDALRTEQDLLILAAKEGWIGEKDPDGNPGRVSRDSQHLERNGASGVDYKVLIGSNLERMPVPQLAAMSRKYFDYVQEYDDHVHGDQRDGALKWSRA